MRDRSLSAASFHVRLGGSVAAFASRALRRLRSRCNAREVAIFIKIEPNIGVTRFAGLGIDELLTGEVRVVVPPATEKFAATQEDDQSTRLHGVVL